MKDDNESNRVKPITTHEDDNYFEIINLLKSSLLAEQSVDYLDNYLDTASFKDYILTTEKNISKAISMLTLTDSDSGLPTDVVLYTVLFSGEHSGNVNWTSSKIQSSMKQLQKIVLEQCCCNNILDLLLMFKVNYFLTELQPKLLSSTWKKYPAAVECFFWILLHLKYPHVGDNLNSILPTCLLLVDDHVNSSKIKGLKCLHHLSKHLSRTDLIQYGRGDVIYNAVEHMIYNRDPEIIPELGKFLVEFLNKTEHSFTSNTLSWTRFDDVINIWLPSMEMEQKLVIREAYIVSLKGLLQAMGLASVRWSVKLLSILSEYSETEHTRDEALICLLTFINATWPKISSNAHSIVSILMKVCLRIYNNPATSKPSESTERLLKECFHTLKKTSDRECNKLISEVYDNKELNKCCAFIIEGTH